MGDDVGHDGSIGLDGPECTAEATGLRFQTSEYGQSGRSGPIAACRSESVVNADKRRYSDMPLATGRASLLRRFVDTDGNKQLDNWS